MAKPVAFPLGWLLLCIRSETVGIALGKAIIHPQVAAFDPAEHRQPFSKRGDLGLNWTVLRCPGQNADSAHGLGPLRARRERPRRCAAESCDELAPSKAHLPLPVRGTLR